MENEKVNLGNCPTRILLYVVIDTETNDVVFKTYDGREVHLRKKELNKVRNTHIIDIRWIEQEFTEVYEEYFIDEDEAAEIL